MLRFTIRDLLWLMVVVGMALGWWSERTNERAILIKSHAQLEEFRQLLGERNLADLSAMAKTRQQAPSLVNTVVINLPTTPKPTTKAVKATPKVSTQP
jgi:hypothetical protein